MDLLIFFNAPPVYFSCDCSGNTELNTKGQIVKFVTS